MVKKNKESIETATTVVDVAEYILAKQGEMTSMKLHRLLYYCYAWHLVWSKKPLFKERIEAWANGPVVPALFELHRGYFRIYPGFFRAALALQSVPLKVVTEKESGHWVWAFSEPNGAEDFRTRSPLTAHTTL